jgi:hypothetical protein
VTTLRKYRRFMTPSQSPLSNPSWKTSILSLGITLLLLLAPGAFADQWDSLKAVLARQSSPAYSQLIREGLARIDQTRSQYKKELIDPKYQSDRDKATAEQLESQRRGSRTLRWAGPDSNEVGFWIRAIRYSKSMKELSPKTLQTLNGLVLGRGEPTGFRGSDPGLRPALPPPPLDAVPVIAKTSTGEPPPHLLGLLGSLFGRAGPVILGSEVDTAMTDFFVWFRHTKALADEGLIHPIDLAAQSHQWLDSIQAFESGNGRTAWIVLNWILAKYGYPPCDFMALHSAVSHRPGPDGNLAAGDFQLVVINGVKTYLNTALASAPGFRPLAEIQSPPSECGGSLSDDNVFAL